MLSLAAKDNLARSDPLVHSGLSGPHITGLGIRLATEMRVANLV